MEMKLFASVLFCGLWVVTSADIDYEYYHYDVHYTNSQPRSKRYVDHVISRLADSVADRPSIHDKTSLTPSGGGGGSPSPHKELEMIGNIAVMHEEPVESLGRMVSTDLPSSTTSMPAHSDVPEKPVKDWSGKKVAPTEKKVPTKAVTGYEGLRRSSPSPVSEPAHDDYEPSTDDFPQDITNNTLENHNITGKQEDHFKYYNMSFVVDPKMGKDYWVDMEREKDVIINEMLSHSHRRATTVQLRFDFPFYGHIVRNVTIATGGFLYTGDYIHSWLAATQYIAPLMANFDTSLSPDSKIKYRDNGTALTVEWDRVMLQDRYIDGAFTFQVTLHSSGDIVFVYKAVPIDVHTIEDTAHPVKVGLSDAYIIDKNVFFMRRKTIYEYHRVNFNREEIKNWTAIFLTALPTCLNNKDCTTCLTANLKYQCLWCESVRRCSSGFDRKRQEWQAENCDIDAISKVAYCGRPAVPSHVHLPQVAVQQGSMITVGRESSAEMGPPRVTEGASATTGMLGATVAIVLVAGVALWLFYAYRNPHTPSGQVLIKYRPSQWTQWRRGEARYTAASIHM